jgi:hypothetical protein
VAVDQCKSLLHAGLAAVGYSAVGFKLLLRSAESVAQRTLARRGCLFKVCVFRSVQAIMLLRKFDRMLFVP